MGRMKKIQARMATHPGAVDLRAIWAKLGVRLCHGDNQCPGSTLCSNGMCR
jgi:hypothetical protein